MRALRTRRRSERSVVLGLRGQEWERHLPVGRLAAGLPDFAPRPLDAALIELRRVGPVRLLGIKQCSLRRLDQIVALHMTKPRDGCNDAAREAERIARADHPADLRVEA